MPCTVPTHQEQDTFPGLKYQVFSRGNENINLEKFLSPFSMRKNAIQVLQIFFLVTYDVFELDTHASNLHTGYTTYLVPVPTVLLDAAFFVSA